MGVVEYFGVLVNFLEFHISTRVEGNVVEDHHDFFKEVIYFDWGLELGCD